jgi:hypothetical protein
MNSKRRAELQRKLSMGAVPRPPAGLADRIKADIPKYLDAHPAPERFSWSNTLRVAASILLLLTTALVTREMLQPRRAAAPSAAVEKLEPAVLKYRHEPRVAGAPTTTTTTTAESEVSLDIAQELPMPVPTMAPVAVPQSAPAPPSGRLRADEAAEEADSAAYAYNDAVETESMERKAAAPAPEPVRLAAAAAPPPPPAPVAPPSDMRREVAQTITITASAPMLVPEARAATLQLAPESVFGISVDPKAFPAVRSAIETGERPSPGIVNVEALVNYFAGAKAPRRDVGLEVEASPAPIAVDGDDRAILRFTVDTAAVTVPQRGSIPPVARDARLHIEIDPRAVGTFRRIGDGETTATENALLHNTSVTGLYELSLKPNLRASQRVATVTLRYVSVKTGRTQSIARVIHGHDLARTWENASRRHRLAALGAIWSETLKGTNGGPEVAKRAEELATQNPRDSRARELANAASASIGGAP